MIEGVVLYFSPCGAAAHIWCVLSESPLCIAYCEDFPELWGSLQVGSRVQLRVKPMGALMRVFEMRLFALETAGSG